MRPQRGLVLITAVALVSVACTTSPAEPDATTATSGTTSNTVAATASSTSTQTTTTSPGTTQSPSTTTTPSPPTTTVTTTATTSTSTTTTSTTPPDTTPPRLEVTYPTHGAIVTEEVITFRGVTEPGARVFSGRYAADVHADGSWSLVLVLASGDNGAVLVARDSAGNESKVRLAVTLNRCQDLPSTSIPDTADNLSTVTGDLDGNGVDDTITVYVDTSDYTSWVHMELDYGYATSVLIDVDWFRPEAVSIVRFAGSNALALVKVSEGATNSIHGVFALVGCDAVYTTSGTQGRFTWFNVGASTQYAFGLTCTPEGVARRESRFVGSGDDFDNEPWDITDEEYRYVPERGHFDLVSSRTIQMSWSEIQEQDVSLCHFDCPGVGSRHELC